MQKKMFLKPRLVISYLYLMIASTSVVYADGFYTIIGPDGRPMVVPMNVSKKEPEPNKHIQQVNSEKLPQPVIQSNETEKKLSLPLHQQKKDDLKQFESKKNQLDIVKKKEQAESLKSQPIVIPKVIEQSNISYKNKTEVYTILEKKLPAKIEQPTVTQQVTTNISVIDKPILESKPAAVDKSQVPQTNIAQAKDTRVLAGFSQVDGVDYVNNEYLENQEFNVEGKKRFYTMPDGSGRMETVERKKGVSRSVLDKLFNRTQQSTAPIVLSGTYVRLSSEDLKSAFENDRCFLEGYKKSIKTLSMNKDVGLWPRKPLKEKFEYEVVKLDSSIQYLQIDSYASSNDKPVYYWPLVVFLDENGCIAEGVSGFKSNKTTATVLQHTAIQGVLKVPEHVRYMMMTPLASAVDVSEQELSNQGQVKLSVLQ